MNRHALLTFTRDRLVPKADDILQNTFQAYCEGTDIGIQTKSDNTPATVADRATEEALRTLISSTYPDHGVQGEEFGAMNPHADWIWVLDPLDGTREFLAKISGGFGSLIGLIYKGRAVLGAVSDPINRTHWFSDSRGAATRTDRLDRSVVACTNPDGMFETADLQRGIRAVQGTAMAIRTHLNCIGFTGVVDGTIDAVIENNLKAHDLVPLLPIMLDAGLVVVDLDGNDYANRRFDHDDAFSGRYSVVAAGHPRLVDDILNCFEQNRLE